MALQVGRKGRVFLKKESTYGDSTVTFAATDALRHITLGMQFDPFNRVTSPEKKLSPGPANRFDRRASATWSLEALLRPSGTLNTVPEADEVLEAAFGSKTNVTLATTVAATPTPTTTTATVTSATGLAKGDAILITRNGVRYVRVLTNVTGTALTWAPALPTAPAAGESVKGCITYKLSTNLAISLAVAHYLDTFKRLLLGAAADQLSLRFNANEEPRFTVSGPAKEQLTGSGVPSQPASFTTVGGNPPSGLVGELVIGSTATAYLFKNLEVQITNGLRLRNVEYGSSKASEVYRAGRREITLSLEAFAETEATLYDLAEAGTNTVLLKQTGRTEGNIVALYAPKVEVKVPETSDDDEEVNWRFTGVCLESADGENDELTLALA